MPRPVSKRFGSNGYNVRSQAGIGAEVGMLIKTRPKPLSRKLPTKCTNDAKSEETEITTDWMHGHGFWVARVNSVRGFVRPTSEVRWGQLALPLIHQFSSVRSV